MLYSFALWTIWKTSSALLLSVRMIHFPWSELYAKRFTFLIRINKSYPKIYIVDIHLSVQALVITSLLLPLANMRHMLACKVKARRHEDAETSSNCAMLFAVEGTVEDNYGRTYALIISKRSMQSNLQGKHRYCSGNSISCISLI